MSEERDSVAADVAAAAAELRGADAAPEQVEAPEPAPVEAEAAHEGGEDKPEAAGERPRGPDGKFVPKAKVEAAKPTPEAEETPTAHAKAETAQPGAKPAAPTEARRAPQSWRPAAREKWAALPTEVQEEALRIDGEVRKVLQESAPARKLAQAFNETVAPYRALLTGEPLQVVGNLLQTAAQLQTAPPAQRGALVAQIIKAYGVDVQTVADALDGQAPAQAKPQEHRDPRVDQLLAQLEQQKAAQRQSWVSEAESWLEKQEFAGDVREDMGHLMAAAAQRGVEMTLEQAYNRACWGNDEIRQVLQQREDAKRRQTAQAATAKAKAVGSSVRSTPAGVKPTRSGDSVLDYVKEAAAELMNR